MQWWTSSTRGWVGFGRHGYWVQQSCGSWFWRTFGWTRKIQPSVKYKFEYVLAKVGSVVYVDGICSLFSLWFLLIIFLISCLVHNVICFRHNGPVQSFSRLEVGGAPSDEAHAGYSRVPSKPSHLMPHSSQSSPSRLGQQHQRFSHGRGVNTVRGNDWSYNSGAVGSHTAGNSSFTWGNSWLSSVNQLSLSFWLLVCTIT